MMHMRGVDKPKAPKMDSFDSDSDYAAPSTPPVSKRGDMPEMGKRKRVSKSPRRQFVRESQGPDMGGSSPMKPPKPDVRGMKRSFPPKR